MRTFSSWYAATAWATATAAGNCSILTFGKRWHWDHPRRELTFLSRVPKLGSP